jgi:hypothetical protein
MNTYLEEISTKVPVFIEVQERGDTDKSSASPSFPSHLSTTQL